MEFFDYSLKFYEIIENTDFSKFSKSKNNKYSSNEFPPTLNSLMSVISDNFDHDKFKQLYRDEVSNIINNKLPMCNGDTAQINQLNNIYYYDNSVSKYTWMYLFWIWYNKINIPSEKLKTLLQAIFMGMMGFRLLDISTDDESENKEYLFLAQYLIRNFEKIYLDVFKTKETFDILNYYSLKYNEIEYIEKKNLWKPCPFNWENSNLLGYKTSPLLSLFEVIFKNYNVDRDKADNLILSFLNMLAVNQIVDDLGDAENDLSTGRETLVMTGFYKQYGIGNSWTKENIEDFLTQDRLLNIYNNIVSLFDKAIKLASYHNDIIFMVFIELVRPMFLKKFEFVTTDK